MKKFFLVLACALLCSGCDVAPPVASIPPTQPTPPPVVESPVVTAAPTTPQTPPSVEPVFLPTPTSEMFGLAGDDAVLYDAAVERCFRPSSNTSSDLFLPSLSILDSYTDKDGNTCYVCLYGPFSYQNFANAMRLGQNPPYDYLGSGRAATRFTLAKQADGSVQCIDIKEISDGEGAAASLREIFGPNKKLADAYIAHDRDAMKTPLVEPRDLTPIDPVEILRVYLDHFFASEG